jgi:hypothetical protein
MSGVMLEKTREEKDLGVIVSDTLKPAAQCAKAAKTAMGVLGQIVVSSPYQKLEPNYYLQQLKSLKNRVLWP